MDQVSIDLPWVEKYRPKSVEDVVGHVDLLNTLSQFIQSGSIPHLLLHGPPGTGKTTIVKALAQQIYGSDMRSMVLELNASDDRGIDVVRNVIKEFASVTNINISGNESLSVAAQMKIVILDEADQMTTQAQMSLRRIIEMFSSTVRFCILCNYINKINPAVQSRCTKFRLPPLKFFDVKGRLEYICTSEGLDFDAGALKAIYKISKGDMRRLVNTLQSTSMIGKREKTMQDVFCDLGYPEPQTILDLKAVLLESNFDVMYDALIQLHVSRGFDLNDIVELLYDSLMDATDWPLAFAGIVVPKLADILHSLAKGADQEVMAGSVVACIIEGRFVIQKTAEGKSLVSDV